MVELKNKFDFEKLINGEKVLVDFHADWCGPCKAIDPIIDSGLEVVKVDTDRFMSIARDQHIITIPNLKIFSRGKLIKEKTGIMTKDELIKFVTED